MTSMSGVSIVVTDAETAAALACIRALGRCGYSVYAVGSLPFPAAAASLYLASYVQIASPWGEPAPFLDGLLKFCKSVSADLVLPVSEAAVYLLSSLRQSEELPFALLCSNEALLQVGLSKIETFRRSIATQTPVSQGYILEPGDSCDQIRALGWPLIVRTDNWVDDKGIYRKGQSWIARSSADFLALKWEAHSLCRPIVVQKYIVGSGVGAFFLFWNGHIVLWHTHKRLAEIPWQGGVSARRMLDFNNEIKVFSERFMSGLGVSGLAMVEYREASKERSLSSASPYYLVEVNARPWGSMALALHGGIPFLTQWIDHHLRVQSKTAAPLLARKPLETSHSGLICTSLFPGEAQHLLSVGSSLVHREISLKTALNFLKDSVFCLFNPKAHFDFLVKDDPLPAVRQLLNALNWMFSSLLRVSRKLLTRLCLDIAEKGYRFARPRRVAFDVSPKSILVVCLGNRCRSPFLEQILRMKLVGMDIQVTSRGIRVVEKNVPRRFHEIFRHHGCSAEEHFARQLEADDLNLADAVVVMELWHLLYVVRKFGWKNLRKCWIPLGEKNEKIEICDPYSMGPVDASRVFTELETRGSRFARAIKETRFSYPVNPENDFVTGE